MAANWAQQFEDAYRRAISPTAGLSRLPSPPEHGDPDELLPELAGAWQAVFGADPDRMLRDLKKQLPDSIADSLQSLLQRIGGDLEDALLRLFERAGPESLAGCGLLPLAVFPARGVIRLEGRAFTVAYVESDGKQVPEWVRGLIDPDDLWRSSSGRLAWILGERRFNHRGEHWDAEFFTTRSAVEHTREASREQKAQERQQHEAAERQQREERAAWERSPQGQAARLREHNAELERRIAELEAKIGD